MKIIWLQSWTKIAVKAWIFKIWIPLFPHKQCSMVVCWKRQRWLRGKESELRRNINLCREMRIFSFGHLFLSKIVCQIQQHLVYTVLKFFKTSHTNEGTKNVIDARVSFARMLLAYHVTYIFVIFYMESKQTVKARKYVVTIKTMLYFVYWLRGRGSELRKTIIFMKWNENFQLWPLIFVQDCSPNSMRVYF